MSGTFSEAEVFMTLTIQDANLLLFQLHTHLTLVLIEVLMREKRAPKNHEGESDPAKNCAYSKNEQEEARHRVAPIIVSEYNLKPSNT